MSVIEAWAHNGQNGRGRLPLGEGEGGGGEGWRGGEGGKVRREERQEVGAKVCIYG